MDELRARRWSEREEVLAAAALWLALDVPLLLVHSPFFGRFVVYLLVPMALFSGTTFSRPAHPRVRLRSLAVFAGVWLVFAAWSNLWPTRPEGATRQAIADLRSHVPASARVVTDEQGLAWWAGRLTPDNLVDTSSTRIKAGALTMAAVVDAARTHDVCAVLPWSGRFASLADRGGHADPYWLSTLEAQLPDYQRVADYGSGRVLLIRKSCRLS